MVEGLTVGKTISKGICIVKCFDCGKKGHKEKLQEARRTYKGLEASAKVVVYYIYSETRDVLMAI